jgi:lipopolysaccharide transport system permease protein
MGKRFIKHLAEMHMLSLFTRHGLTTVRRISEREVRTRVAGTVLGFLHYIITPIFFLSIYTFVFGAVFVTRWSGESDGFGGYALRLYAGLIVFQFFAEVLNRSSGLILENPSYVKKIVFPLELLVPAAIGTALFASAISYVVFGIGFVVMHGLPPLSILSLALLWPPFVLSVAGISWALAALGVFLRDLSQFVSTLVPSLMFVSPIFYPLSMVPDVIRPILYLNPITYYVEAMRGAIFAGVWPSLTSLALAYASSIVLASAGLWVFVRLRKAFADVM